MADRHKRRKITAFILVVVISVIFLPTCSNGLEDKNTETGENDRLAVHYIDVGEGDATLIRLPDGKVMLIDTGEDSEENFNKISSCIDKYGKKIDYLILSHPDIEHYGCAKNIINKYEIGKVFIPRILNTALYPEFFEVISLIDQKEIEKEISRTYLSLSTEDYALIFISPDFDGKDSSYDEFNTSFMPDQRLADDVSPIIYLEYVSVRFVFSADAGAKEEKRIVTNYNLGLYKNVTINGWSVNLSNVDFYKLSSHGGLGANSYEFLSLLKPKNAVISVGGGNRNGNPATDVLIRLEEINREYNLFRTDRDKTISVLVNNDGKTSITKGE